MRLVTFAPQAVQDIAAILAWSEERFGSLARARYEQLIETAIRDIAGDPDRLGNRRRPELAEGDENLPPGLQPWARTAAGRRCPQAQAFSRLSPDR